MNIQDDIISHKTPADAFYNRLKATTIANAAQEPLTLGALSKKGAGCAPPQVLPTDVEVSYGGALCYYCLLELMKRYARTRKPDKYDTEYMAREMMLKYKHWSVLDLPTFVSMCIGSRLPTMRLGEIEYELVILDIPGIMGKLEAYDRMKPNPQALQGGSPAKAVEKELTDWQKTHLLDGTPYDWEDLDECRRYWSAPIDMSNPAERQFRENAGTKAGGCIETVDEVLSKNAQSAKIAIHSSNHLATTSLPSRYHLPTPPLR